MSDWIWLTPAVIFAIHDRQLAEHGGAGGVRDRGAVDSALARPRNLAAYEEPDAAALAAAYLWGFVRDHGFVDGNKRVAWVAARLFLRHNGRVLRVDRHAAVRLVESAAGGEISEAQAAAWLRERLEPR